MGVKIRQKVKGRGSPWWVFVSHNRKRTSIKVGTKKAAEAVDDELIDVNPVSNTGKYIKRDDFKKEIYPFSWEEKAAYDE